MSLAFSYPFMKRITYWPQLFLGLTFNWGIIMAWSAINNDISVQIITLYLSAIFWTLGYDTIYGAQDMSDDEIIGLKSTSIKFKKNIKLFVSICYYIKNIACSLRSAKLQEHTNRKRAAFGQPFFCVENFGDQVYLAW